MSAIETASPWTVVKIPGHEPIDLLEIQHAIGMEPAACLIMGYTVRCGKREGGGATKLADLRKARQCLDRWIEIEEAAEAERRLPMDKAGAAFAEAIKDHPRNSKSKGRKK